MIKKKNILIFIGPPGCGKGSLSSLCVKRLGFIQLSTGNLFRQHIANKTPIGKMIDFNIKSGKLISDQLVIDMVEDWISNNIHKYNNIILDGFPRTIAQASELNRILLKFVFCNIELSVFKIDVSDKNIIDRLVNRAVCKNNECQSVFSLSKGSSLNPREAMKCDDCGSDLIRRSDDEIQTIKDRLEIYRKNEHELLSFYESNQIRVNVINGELELEQVYRQLVNFLGI